MALPTLSTSTTCRKSNSSMKRIRCRHRRRRRHDLLALALLYVLTQLAVSVADAAAAAAKTIRTAKWNVESVRSDDFVLDRVAILTTRRDSADAWCMGLLVAPDALLTYAHCVADKNITWAFFGNTRESFGEAQQKQPVPPSPSSTDTPSPQPVSLSTLTHAMPYPKDGAGSQSTVDVLVGIAAMNGSTATPVPSTPSHASPPLVATLLLNTTTANRNASFRYASPSASHRHNNTRSIPKRSLRNAEVEVGDVANWIAVVDVIVHPEYNPHNSTTFTKDMAIVRLQMPRENVAPFQLLPDEPVRMNRTRVEARNEYVGYRISNAFVTRAEADKVQSIGSFYRTFWRYCTGARVNGKVLHRKQRRRNQMCIVPAEVSKRVALSTINSFVLVGDQLAGLSLCHSTDCQKSVVHPFALVSGVKDFLEHATQKQDTWTNPMLFSVGGSSAMLQGYLAGLRATKESNNFCLGTLIAPHVVLTAAHCVNGATFSYVSVGSLYSASEEDGEQIKVKSVTMHSAFNASSFAYDFALVELQYMSIQAPLVLDNEPDADLFRTSTLTLYAYNDASKAAESASTEKHVLESLVLPLVQTSVCAAMMNDAKLDPKTIVCAGGEEGRDGCRGDSGAPLVQESNGNDRYLVALSSFGWGCGIKGVPAVYAKVTAATSFIDKYAKGHTWRYTFNSNGQVVASADDDDDDDGDGDGDAGFPASLPPHPQPRQTPRTSRPRSSSEAGWSGRDAASSNRSPSTATGVDDVITQICLKEQWTRTAHIALTGHLQALMIPPSTSQFTRDTVATTLLASSGAEVFEDDDAKRLARSKYVCAGSIELFSSADLGPIQTTLAVVENRALRKRQQRFVRAPGMVRLPVA